MYAHLFKVVKRKTLPEEDVEILCKHGNVKNSSGENLLHHYLRHNVSFSTTIANRLREACGFESSLKDGETIFESVMFLDDPNQEEKLQWLLDFPEAYTIRRNFVFALLRKASEQFADRHKRVWKTHTMDTVYRPFSETELFIIKEFADKGLLDKEQEYDRYKGYLHPGYLFVKEQDYDWFRSTFVITFAKSPNLIKYTRDETLVAGRKEEALLFKLFNDLSNDLQALSFGVILHYHSYEILRKLIEVEGVKTYAWINDSFVKYGYSKHAVQNMEKLIVGGQLVADGIRSFPKQLLRGLLHGECDIWTCSIYNHSGTSEYLPFFNNPTKTCDLWKPFNCKNGKPCVPKKGRYSYESKPVKEIYDLYAEAHGSWPSDNAVDALRQMWIKMAEGADAHAEEEILESLLKGGQIPWRNQKQQPIQMSSTSSTTEASRDQTEIAQVQI